MTRVGWVDASAGASGDMLLGALVDAGVPLDVLQRGVDAVCPEEVRLRAETVARGGFRATRVHVEGTDSTTRRTWADIRDRLAGRPLAVFTRLAQAEARVHGVSADEVHFHEVGALDALADVAGVCAGVAHLGLDRLVVSPVAVGSGTVDTEHGPLPVPPPAVAELLRGFPSYAGPGDTETCTPTGAALLTTLATGTGPQPAMTTDRVGVGAGGRDPEGHANVLRLLVGEATATAPSTQATLLQANIDDLDPRVWPAVIAALLQAGASDAWLTPILMKKGRPAHTLEVLVGDDRRDAVRREVFRQTSTIGLRELAVAKAALVREMRSVTVAGHEIAVKVALLDGEPVNAQPEYDHVAAAAASLGRPVREVLAEAAARARDL